MKQIVTNQIAQYIFAALLGLMIFTGVKAQECYAINLSKNTDCAEADNVDASIIGNGASKIKIVATHPTYPFGLESCAPDFTNCNIGPGGDPVDCDIIYDDGINVIRTCIEDNWWRDSTMTVQLTGGISKQAHYVVLIKKIEGANSWPEFFVLYQDGNLRLIPHPPVGVSSVCYGSSVIVGPAEQDSIRPFAEIDKIQIDPKDFELFVSYENGGDATLVTSVNRDSAVVDIDINYSTTTPIAIFRSMFVEDGNCDVDHISANNDDFSILADWEILESSSFHFFRKFTSIHNNSSPDIRIEIDKLSSSLNQIGVQKEDFLIFPNPALNSIRIRPTRNHRIEEIEIYTIGGQLVRKIHSNFHLIELNDLKEGIYLINIISNGQSALMKLVKL